MDMIVEALPAIGQVGHDIYVWTRNSLSNVDWMFSLDFVCQVTS